MPRAKEKVGPKTHLVGIDEAGRGPLAGPVAIGAVKVSSAIEKTFFKGIKDSKQLSPEERELWFSLALEARRRGMLDFAVSLVSEKVIDRRGIAYAIRLGIKRALDRLDLDPKETHVFLDGSLRAPREYIHQLTVIKGDEKIPVVSLASIVAKVLRDRRMERLAKKYPGYGFKENKGYGTSNHIDALKMFGPSEIHRKSFLTKVNDRKDS